MFKPRTIWGWIRYFISTTEEYSNGEIVERGVQIGNERRLILAVHVTSPGIILRYLSADYEEMCDAGWEVGLYCWQIAWGHGYYRHITGRWDWGSTYYDFGYSFDEMHWLGADTLYNKAVSIRWRNWWYNRTHGSPSGDFTPPPNDNEIPF
jgi:hypothetical protein